MTRGNSGGPYYSSVASWYGANTALAHRVGELLGGVAWAGVPFAGGMCELRYLKARSLVVSDKHRHVINLARVIADRDLWGELVRRLNRLPFHPDVLAESQAKCEAREAGVVVGPSPDLDWAVDYFVCAWVGRCGTAGSATELSATMSVRWSPGGGDSAGRFRNAVKSLGAWHRVMRRCTFVTLDVFDFLRRVHDRTNTGLYCDPPFPGPGNRYKHKFSEEDHRRLAAALGGYRKVRVVCRFYDAPLVRDLYPEGPWRWHSLAGGRKQTNEDGPEVLLVNGG